VDKGSEWNGKVKGLRNHKEKIKLMYLNYEIAGNVRRHVMKEEPNEPYI
jgi:hypothetical protein